MARFVGKKFVCFVASMVLCGSGFGRAQTASPAVVTGASVVHPAQRERVRVVQSSLPAMAKPAVRAKAQATAGKTAPQGGPGVTVSSAGFGNATIGGQPVSMTLIFSASAGGSTTIAPTVNKDFTITSRSCDSYCIVQVRFQPQFPGLRYDAIQAINSSGTVLAETYVYGTGVGPQAGYDLGGVTVYQGLIQQPGGVALGPDRRGYITDTATNAVYRFDNYSSNGFNFTQLAITGLGIPSGVAVDGGNTVYVADQANDSIVTYTETLVNGQVVVTQGTLTTIPITSPTGLAVDGTGALYIADTGDGRILKVDNQGNNTILIDRLNAPTGVAVDSSGNVFFVDSGSAGEIVELPAGGGSPVTLASSIGSPEGISLDPSGRIYFTTPQGLGFINGTDVTLPYYGGTDGPDGIALGPNGDLFYTNRADGTFTITDRSTSNFIVAATVGGMASGSATVANTGNASLSLYGLNVTGTAFTVDPSSDCTQGTSLDPGTTCHANIDFNPVAPGHDTETLTVTSNSLNGEGSDVFTLYGDGGPTTTALTASTTSPSAGQPVTFTASVTDNLGGTLPTGMVSFVDGQTTLSTMPLSQSPNSATTGQATFTTSTLAIGTHSIVATYLGSTTLETSSSAPQTVTVMTGAMTTNTSVSVSPATVHAGAPETLTATIQSSTSPGITGTVTFYDQNGALGSGAVTATGTGGTASLTITFLTVGSHQIYGLYNGDGTYAPSLSGMQTVTVTPALVGTVTTLTVDRSSVVYRTPIALTAAVATTDGAVTAGQVIFCDAAAAHCTPELSLATAQLNGSGRAVARLPAGIAGSHTFTATFLGTGTYAKSVSAPRQVTVTMPGTYTTYTTIASTGSVGNYTLTGTVTGLLTRAAAPSGTVTFNDTTNATALGTATLGAAVLGFQAVQPSGSPVAVGRGAYGVATGDFNGDGYPDVVVENYFANTVSVLLGQGNGSFQPQVTYAVGGSPERVLVADFNGDGFLDLAVANTGSGTISVLLGNGDGTFRAQVTYGAGSPVGLGVMDVNHDGIADLVAGDYYQSTVSVLLGNGNGTFRAAVTYPTGSTPQTLAEGDFNGDGNVDIAVGNLGNNNVGILLGNGDGTFRTQVTYPVGGAPQGVQVGDFNGDGIDDLAVVNSGTNTVSILRGKGDGTFQPQVTYPVGANPVGLVIADFNGDGFQDISVGNTAQTALTQGILFGNGDGTFQPQKTYATGNFPYGEAVADFNGDGFPDLAIANFNDATATILLSEVTETATASISAVGLAAPPGTHTVTAAYAGDTNFSPSVSPSIALTSTVVTPIASMTSLSVSPTSQTFGQSVVFSVSVTGGLQTSLLPTGTVTLMNAAASPATVLGIITLGPTGAGSVSISALPVGAYSVVAVYGGDANFTASTSAAQALAITPIATATALGVSAASISAGQSETLTATITAAGGGTSAASLSGTVTFSDQSGVLGTGTVAATTGGGAASLMLASLPVGTHRITATYGGNASDAGSTSAVQTVVVSLVAQTIAFPAIPSHTTTDAPFALSATASSGLAVTYALVSGPATLSGSTVALTGAGTVVIQASQAGNGTYAAAAPVTQSFTVSLAAQTIAFPAIGSHTTTDPAFALGATASSGLAVTYALVSGPATLSGSTVTLTGAAGTVVLQATQPGNTTYAAATPVTQSVAVALAAQTITFPAIANHTVGDPAFPLGATASSGLAVTYAVVSGPATVSGSLVTVTGAGTVVLQATQPGNITYAAAPPVTQSVTVAALPAVTLAAVSPAVGLVGAAATTVTLTGTNFAARDLVQLNGTAIGSTFVNATTLTAVIPASFFTAAGTGQITVLDPTSGVASGAAAFVVIARPAVVFSGPTTATSGQQPTVTFQLVNPYPYAITGTFTLTFTPSAAAGVNDPAVQFSTGGRTLAFTIPANSTATPSVQLQTGTVAGTATITIDLLANGLDVTPANAAPVVIVIPTAMPSLTSATLTRSGTALSVVVHGFSNTREVVSAIFHFTPVDGQTINNQDVTVSAAADFAQWYASTASAQYGSSFTYTQQFTLDQDAGTVASVTVTLMNAVGTSPTVTAQ